MVVWLHVALVAASIGCLIALLMVFLWRWCCYKPRQDHFIEPPPRNNRMNLNHPESLQAGIARLHNQAALFHQFELEGKSRGNFYWFKRESHMGKLPLFNWSDYPSLVTDAVENGWSRFAFTGFNLNGSSPSRRSTLLGICSVGDLGRETDIDISWEVCQGSVDFMQKIRLNPGLKRVSLSNSYVAVGSVIRTALPLPGPHLGNSAFPQEAYFEITILSSSSVECELVGKVGEGEKAKLIQDHSNSKANSEALVHNINQIEEFNVDCKEWGKGECVAFCLGLTCGGTLPLRILGTYPGSIGYSSNGSIYLDGMKLVFESQKEEWCKSGKVVGCGFDPRQKKVYFTLDSELVHVINCKSEEFGTPLFPTMAANDDIMVLVNFGQTAFKYAPANAQRTPNPCFIGGSLVSTPSAAAAALGYEDSRELFSMGRIDSQWLSRSANKGSHNNGINNRGLDFEEESEGDLFEIVLDGCGRSPNAVL